MISCRIPKANQKTKILTSLHSFGLQIDMHDGNLLSLLPCLDRCRWRALRRREDVVLEPLNMPPRNLPADLLHLPRRQPQRLHDLDSSHVHGRLWEENNAVLQVAADEGWDGREGLLGILDVNVEGSDGRRSFAPEPEEGGVGVKVREEEGRRNIEREGTSSREYILVEREELELAHRSRRMADTDDLVIVGPFNLEASRAVEG